MKTLDEVIFSYDYCDDDTDAGCSKCPYLDDCSVSVSEAHKKRFADALHYLKEYREKQRTLEIREAEYKRGFEQLGVEWSRLKDNPPLTWDELKTMEGKPVWIVGERMKTLDEVIKAYEICHASILSCEDCQHCPYESQNEGGLECVAKYHDDALHYLKAYKDDKDDLTALRAYWAEQQANPPLLWNELKQMEGKPVWVEDQFGFGQWFILRFVFEEGTLVANDKWGNDLVMSEAQMNNTWQAYRKERHEDA